jgi:predicted ribosomally synthesized peptide with SipW-like signal peptide
VAQRRNRRWRWLRSLPQPCDPTLRRAELMARRRVAARRRLRHRTLIPVGLIVLVLALIAGSALAWWSATASMRASITTGTWAAASIRLFPGSAQAPHANPAKPQCPKLLPIASPDSHGALALDFGDQKPSSSNAYSDVFRITSLASTPLTITFALTGAATSFVQSVGLQDSSANTLAAKATGSVVVKLLIPQSTTPGKYSGQLIVGIGGSSEKYALSLVINVVGSATVKLSPGPAKAPHANPAKPECPKLLPIASVGAQGALTLDFGDQQPGASVTYCDVFRITSLIGSSQKLTFTTTGSVATLIQSVSLPGCRNATLAAHGTVDVAIKLAVPKGATQGVYSGQLAVGIAGASETYTLPLVVNVVLPAHVKLSPGTAKAPHANPSKPSSPALLPIASVDAQSALTLDFGDQQPGASITYCDVFRITSLIGSSQRLTFTPSGAAAALIQSVRLEECHTNTLPARATRALAVKLAIPRSAAPGHYTGQLVVGIAGTSEVYTLPIVVNVPGKSSSPSPAAPISTPQAPSPTQTPTSSPTPTDTPSSTPSETPSSTPSATPSETPSATPSDMPTSAPSPSNTDTPSPTSTDSPGSPT